MYLVPLVKYGIWIGLLCMRNGMMGVSLLDYLVNKCNQKDLKVVRFPWIYGCMLVLYKLPYTVFFFCI